MYHTVPPATGAHSHSTHSSTVETIQPTAPLPVATRTPAATVAVAPIPTTASSAAAVVASASLTSPEAHSTPPVAATLPGATAPATAMQLKPLARAALHDLTTLGGISPETLEKIRQAKLCSTTQHNAIAQIRWSAPQPVARGIDIGRAAQASPAESKPDQATGSAPIDANTAKISTLVYMLDYIEGLTPPQKTWYNRLVSVSECLVWLLADRQAAWPASSKNYKFNNDAYHLALSAIIHILDTTQYHIDFYDSSSGLQYFAENFAIEPDRSLSRGATPLALLTRKASFPTWDFLPSSPHSPSAAAYAIQSVVLGGTHIEGRAVERSSSANKTEECIAGLFSRMLRAAHKTATAIVGGEKLPSSGRTTRPPGASEQGTHELVLTRNGIFNDILDAVHQIIISDQTTLKNLSAVAAESANSQYGFLLTAEPLTTITDPNQDIRPTLSTYLPVPLVGIVNGYLSEGEGEPALDTIANAIASFYTQMFFAQHWRTLLDLK